jgi:hypothetical protein
MRYAHPYFTTRKQDQHESARERLERDARDFLARKAAMLRRLAGRRVLVAA